MPTKTASIVSVVLTLLMLVVFAVIALAVELVALNGVSERQGITAMGVSLLCLSAGALLLGLLAWRVTSLLTTKYNLNPILAVIITVLLGTVAGGLVSLGSLFPSIPAAGIR